MQTQTKKSITQTLANHLAEGTITPQLLSETMTEHFGGTDAQHKWNWKLAYEFLEASWVVYLRSLNSYHLSMLQRLEKRSLFLVRSACSSAWTRDTLPRSRNETLPRTRSVPLATLSAIKLNYAGIYSLFFFLTTGYQKLEQQLTRVRRT